MSINFARMMNNSNTNPPPADPDLARLDALASILDNRFRVPGTQVRFGLDGLMGLVPEEPALYDYLTAREFLEFVVGVRGKGAVDEALELSGLGPDADRLIREYSQGMRRRTALAAAVVSHPPLLVLDEAINGLDPVSADRVESFLQRRCAAGRAWWSASMRRRRARPCAGFG